MTVFDRDNNRLGFVPSYDVPIPTLPYNYRVLIIIVSVIGGVIILSIILCIILYKSKSKDIVPKNRIEQKDKVESILYNKTEPVIEKPEPVIEVVESAVDQQVS